VSELSLV